MTTFFALNTDVVCDVGARVRRIASESDLPTHPNAMIIYVVVTPFTVS